MAGNGVELVWEGKRRDVERVPLPFQRVEIINESRATRQAGPLMRTGPQLPPDPLFADAAGDAPWRNKLIWGDNRYVLSSLIEGDPSIGLDPLAGEVDLIYIDPPFATGQDFSFSVQIGDEEVEKEPSPMETRAYRDTWGKGMQSYLQLMYERLVLMKSLLSPRGLLYVHCDRRVNFLLRSVLDGLFGEENLRNEIIWCYRGGGTPDNDFAEKHDTILRYSSSADYFFDVDPVRIPYSAASAERQKHELNVFRGDKVYREYEPNELGKHPEDWWTIQPLMPSEKQERIVAYPTQKPIELLQRIVESSCPPGGLVLDVFCGSGSTMVAAEGLRVIRDDKDRKSVSNTGKPRRWIGCDLSRWAVSVARKRLLHVENCRPFEVVNLARYERRYWQGMNAGEAVYEYFQFIVKLYHAEPVVGFTNLHGRKGEAMVHVGATDAPVTISEVRAAMDECKVNGLKVSFRRVWVSSRHAASRPRLESGHAINIGRSSSKREGIPQLSVNGAPSSGSDRVFERPPCDVQRQSGGPSGTRAQDRQTGNPAGGSSAMGARGGEKSRCQNPNVADRRDAVRSAISPGARTAGEFVPKGFDDAVHDAA